MSTKCSERNLDQTWQNFTLKIYVRSIPSLHINVRMEWNVIRMIFRDHDSTPKFYDIRYYLILYASCNFRIWMVNTYTHLSKMII